MSIREIQLLLKFLSVNKSNPGYDPGEIDGLDGPRTQAALAAIQRDYGVGADGLCGIIGGTVPPKKSSFDELVGETLPDAGNFWDRSEYMTREEYRCRCGGKYCDGYPAEPQELLVELENTVRRHFGRPAINSSGLRCEKHNAAVGGKANSRHRLGKAVDFRIDGVSSAVLDAYIATLHGVRYHYQIDGSYCHMDIL